MSRLAPFTIHLSRGALVYRLEYTLIDTSQPVSLHLPNRRRITSKSEGISGTGVGISRLLISIPPFFGFTLSLSYLIAGHFIF